MACIVIDLMGNEETIKTETNKKTVELKPSKEERDRQVQKQVINISGQIVTV